MNITEQIANCEYHITIAQMGYTNQKTKCKWLKRLKELKKQLKRKEPNYEQQRSID